MRAWVVLVVLFVHFVDCEDVKGNENTKRANMGEMGGHMMDGVSNFHDALGGNTLGMGMGDVAHHLGGISGAGLAAVHGGVGGHGDGGHGNGMGYFSQECNAEKKCLEGKWCDMGLCVDMLLENIACTRQKQCSKSPDELICAYGKCLKKDGTPPIPTGSPGTFCDKSEDCTKPAATKGCCVLVPAINPLKKICIPRLNADQFCGLHHFFGHNSQHNWDTDSDACNPCIEEHECKNRGIFAPFMICVKKPPAKREIPATIREMKEKRDSLVI